MADQNKPRRRSQPRDGNRPQAGKRPQAGSRPQAGQRPQGGTRSRGEAPRVARERTVEQARYDGPPLDESITGSELSREIRQQLRGLPEKLATRVARHLVAAAQLIEDDPRTAYQHTLAARARAARISVVREACGEAAYAAGEYSDALSELRAVRRMTGRNEYLPVMADCERALGRPERALALAKDAAVADLDEATRAEMTIVAAGARLDLGQPDAALSILEAAPLRSRARAEWVVRLRYAYADALLAAGRRADAIEWFHRTAGSDGAGLTDAAERLAELEATPGTGPGPEGEQPTG